MSYISVKDDEGKVVMTWQVGGGIKVKEIVDAIEEMLEKMGTEIAI